MVEAAGDAGAGHEQIVDTERAFRQNIRQSCSVFAVWRVNPSLGGEKAVVHVLVFAIVRAEGG